MLVPIVVSLLAATSPRCEFVSQGVGPEGTVPVHAEKVVTGLEVPWSLAFLPNGDWLITERPGRLRRVHAGKLVEKPLATVDIGDTSEGGLLGMAVAPDFQRSRAILLYVTRAKGGEVENSVERWVLSGDLSSAKRERVLLGGIPAARYHDGGRLRIGPDGMLYVTVGDATHSERAQDKTSLNGKVLRLTLDGKPAAGNPVGGSPVFVYGVRNPEGLDWLDRRTLVLSDHGPTGEVKGWHGHDEINVARAGDNLGWPKVHGCDPAEGTVVPVLSWEQAVPPGGLAIYSGKEIPQWRGSILVGVLGARHLHRVVLDPKDPHHVLRHEVYFLGDPPEGLGRLRDVVQGPDGALYVTTSNCDGRGTCPDDKDAVIRIRPGKR
jgi:glucose/arabinose dehydrogenase